MFRRFLDFKNVQGFGSMMEFLILPMPPSLRKTSPGRGKMSRK